MNNNRTPSAQLEPASAASEPVPNRFVSRAGASGTVKAFSGSSGLVEVFGAGFGIAGAFLLALPVPAGWGFGAFLLSNICWLTFSAGHGHRALFVQQLLFLVSSLLGLWNWWLGPLLLG